MTQRNNRNIRHNRTAFLNPETWRPLQTNKFVLFDLSHGSPIRETFKMANHEFQQQRLIGYARVSTSEQELSLQIDSLLNHGVKRENIFYDKLSGNKADRPGLILCQESMQRGDTLVDWRLDRLGRSMRHLVTMIEELKERGIGFRSICDGVIDTTTPSGELIFHVFSALAQFERRLIQERTKAGLAAARARGRKGGLPPLDPNEPRVVLAQKLFRDKSNIVDDICTTLKLSRTTLYRYVSMAEANIKSPQNSSE